MLADGAESMIYAGVTVVTDRSEMGGRFVYQSLSLPVDEPLFGGTGPVNQKTDRPTDLLRGSGVFQLRFRLGGGGSHGSL